MTVLIYLAPNADWRKVFKSIDELQDSKVYLAAQVVTMETIEKVPNDQIHFPIIPNHIMQENKQREKLLGQLTSLAIKIEKLRPDLTVIPTLVGSDLAEFKEQLINSSLKINKFKEIT
ncbi:MAG: hypothetical protein M3Z38_01635 [Bombilactobacillus mellifer]|nr:hypothetical protein [Bombilactobacillus mellifer]